MSYVTRYLDAYYYAITTLTTVGYGDRVRPAASSLRFFVRPLSSHALSLSRPTHHFPAPSFETFGASLSVAPHASQVPRTDAEKLFAIATELAGGMIFGILAGTLSAMVTEQNAAEVRTIISTGRRDGKLR